MLDTFGGELSELGEDPAELRATQRMKSARARTLRTVRYFYVAVDAGEGIARQEQQSCVEVSSALVWTSPRGRWFTAKAFKLVYQ